MNHQKITQKLLKKAKPVEKVEINPENLTEMSLEAFYEAYKKEKGDLYINSNKVYKSTENGYIMAKLGIDLKEIEQKIGILEQDIAELKKWAFDIKDYIDTELNKLKFELDLRR